MGSCVGSHLSLKLKTKRQGQTNEGLVEEAVKDKDEIQLVWERVSDHR